MVRILHYIGGLGYGGSQAFVMELYRKIDRTRLQFDFAAFPGEERIPGFYQEIIALGGRVFACPRYNGRNLFAFRRWWDGFFSAHPEYRVLHGHVRSTASLYLPVAKKHGLATIIHSHSTSNGSGFQAAVKNLMQLPARWQADYLFACSRQTGEWLYGKNATRRDNYRVIPNAIDSARFRYDPARREAARRRLGLEGRFVAGHVGRMMTPKNHAFLIDIFHALYRKEPSARLLLLGEGNLRGAVEEKVRRLGLEEAVLFAGTRRDTETYYQAMDVFVFPSLYEGLGIAAVEAQAAGLPCVVSDTITRDIDLTGNLVTFLPLQESAETWAESVLARRDAARRDTSEEIRRAGYDVTENAARLQAFYLSLAAGDGRRE